jgi:predicted metal-dependent HD superfamily phosphohydrolase
MEDLIIKISLTDDEEIYLKKRFVETLGSYEIKIDKIEKLYDRLYFEYSAWSRHYHNLSHIYSLLKLSEKFRSELNNPFQVDLAIWFHDVVYDSSKKDNELQSAFLFEELMRSYLGKSDIEQVKSLILSTSGHLPLLPEDNDHQYFLDFDLAILSSDTEIYNIYSNAIRDEYISLFSFFVYNNGRKKVLKSFLGRKTLYFSPFFKENCELKARKNLEREIGIL